MAIVVVGLGPSGLDRIDPVARSIVSDPARAVILRTGQHPAAEELSATRVVVTCDDLYEAHDAFDDVYAAIVDRVVEAAGHGDVAYAVPGSPSVGERTVPMVVAAAHATGIEVSVVSAPSFLDMAYVAVGIDPITHGAQILDARELPDPLPLHVPTFITQVDSPLRAGEVAISLGRVLEGDAQVVVLDRLGDEDEVVAPMALEDLARYRPGSRTTVYVARTDVGLLGLVATNRTLRRECPWDREQTHHTLLSHLIEEAYEAADAIGRLPVGAPVGDVDFGTYAEVEDELGDLLLQVVLHATLASEAGAFDVDEVAEGIRRKLVRRHPHVFGDVQADSARDVLDNWEAIKQGEKGRDSLMDDVPIGMPAVARAMKVQMRAASVHFDWDAPGPVVEVLRSEIDELEAAIGDRQRVSDELGDVLFTAVNLARHLDVDPESALRGSVDRFMDRFRIVEARFADEGRSFADVDAVELDAAWTAAKGTTMGPAGQST
ncbi:MAG TPA: nucleoside triphosphate pyrophosphohydrolase [Acidimicrobiia bacterium]|nr:nucleoside triphosphate pyrophosphohydrolase [Acidimicrobiia bacterium]